MDGAVQQIVEQQVLKAAREVEDQIDTQLHHLENLDEDELENLRQKRITDMKRMAQKRQDWAARGHGEYREVEEKQFFAEAKGTERMVCHFYRNSWPCQVMDKHLAALAATHLETKFIKVHAEKAPFLTERLRIWMLPTLAIVKHEKTTDYVVGFDDMGGVDDFSTSALATRLAAVGAIFEDAATAAARAAAAGGGGGSGRQQQHQRTLRTGGPRRTESDEDSDFD